ncbi:MAG TPA: hypothetical protein VIU34_30205 [Steroidobacter sp.]
MQAFRVGVFTLASLVLSFACSTPARADIRPISPVQTLPRPPASAFLRFGEDVAIDSGHIIVLASYEGRQQALLYRRNNSNGQWVYRRALATWTGAYVQSAVAMKNGIAAIQFGDQISLFEYSAGDYVRATSVAPIRHHGGLAISGNSVLVGGNNCDYDAVIYQKNAGGSWDITGRIDDNQGQCLGAFESYDVELNYDYALLHAPSAREATAWRRSSSSPSWVPAGILALLPDEAVADENWALQSATAVAPNGVAWRRSGASTWIRQGVATSVDRDEGGGNAITTVYRDGVLVTLEATNWFPFPRVYLEASPGQFEHVANMPSYDGTATTALDVSGRTVVAAARDFSTTRAEVRVFNLPSQLRAPTPIVNDFEDRDVSDFTFQGGQYALATRGSDDVLVQSATNGLAIAVLSNSDWTDDQRVEADITPTFSGTGSWVGLVARYLDADNYYYVAIRNNQTYGIYKRVNGVDALLYESYFYNTPTPTFRAMLRVIRNQVSVDFGFQQGPTVTDNSLSRGRGGVVTWLARADFDDVHVAGTDEYVPLFTREYGFGGYSYESGLNELSGVWEVTETCDEESCWLNGLSQRDTSGNAVAVIGTPIPNQEINARVRLDSFATSQQGAWFGLLARYVDARNHYYVTVRSTGQIQIRKIVNGVITILGTANFTAVPGRYYDLQFLVINDQLHLYVDRALVATAHDRDIARGQYGIATYRAAANWDAFWVMQP